MKDAAMKDISVKWGNAVAERGFAQIPNYLMQVNMYVHDDHKLSPAELVLLLQLVGTWWRKDEMPFPSMLLLAERSHLSERQVQRSLNALEAKGYLKKVRGKTRGVIASNSYDLTPLVDILGQIAEHFVNRHPRKIKSSAEGRGVPVAPSKPKGRQAEKKALGVVFGRSTGRVIASS